ncbi:hypothetical protein SDC9_175389 [bioreactor metagenome]|uniref:Uncharacterized protein n=1 Tax=bioreactor metagenome TaxID=1076179 RepID=A0A645GMK3_9ZZZZ
MTAPNFWGTSDQAKDLVQGAKDNCNASEVSVSLIDKRGKLRASMMHLDSFVKYSSSAGSWKVKYKRNGVRYTCNSQDSALERIIESAVIESLKTIINKEKEGLADQLILEKCIETIEDAFIKKGSL